MTGDISPKSVVASGRGQVFAENMMYKHSVTVYDRNGDLVTTIPDTVDLSAFGISGHPGISRGVPVEVAFSPDGTKAYVSNYSMYGNGWGPEGSDECHPSDGYDRSYVYRVDVKTLKIDNVILVGSVPKYVATTPDGRYVIVTNWCTFDASIIDVATQTGGTAHPARPVPARHRRDTGLPHGVHRGDGLDHDRARRPLELHDVLDLRRRLRSPTPRALPRRADALRHAQRRGSRREDRPRRRARCWRRSPTGSNPRSMTISADGRYLFVVNYESGTMSKLDANTLADVQTVQTGYHPIGITYDRQTNDVWVANYTGSIMIFGNG